MEHSLMTLVRVFTKRVEVKSECYPSLVVIDTQGQA